MLRTALALLSVLWLLCCSFGQDAVSTHDLAAFFAALPHDTAVDAMYYCPFHGSSSLPMLAMLTENKHLGWQILVYGSYPSGQFDKEWESGALPNEFAVSQAGAFRLVELGDEEYIEFSGCKAHDCVNSVGVLLYSPQQSRKFQAVRRNGQIESSAEVGGSQAVKQYLSSRIKELTSHSPR